MADCPYCRTELEIPCAQCGRHGVAPAALPAPPGFRWVDPRQPYWDAVDQDLRHPCLEDQR